MHKVKKPTHNHTAVLCLHLQRANNSLYTAVMLLPREDWVHSCGTTITEFLCVKIRLPNTSPAAVSNLLHYDSLTCFRAAIDLWSTPTSLLAHSVGLGVLLTVFPSITVHPCLFVDAFDMVKEVFSRSCHSLSPPLPFFFFASQCAFVRQEIKNLSLQLVSCHRYFVPFLTAFCNKSNRDPTGVQEND